MVNNKEELEKICFNCNSFFPALDGFTEEGICLNNPVFEPFIEELLENMNFNICKEAIDNNKFNGSNIACKDFEPVEIGEETPVEEITQENIQELLMEEYIKELSNPDSPIDRYLELIKSTNKDEVENGFNTLFFMSNQRNKNAFNAICDYYISLPPAETLPDVYKKIDFIQRLPVKVNDKKLLDCLLKELYKTGSNNTTKSLISAIFKKIESLPVKIMENDLMKMLKDKKFSYRLKEKMKKILNKNKGMC